MKPLPATERGRRTRAAIVAAAAELMHQHGLAGVSMDGVLAASGAGKSQLYHYFDSRRDLAVAVLHHQFERVMAAQPALRDPACDGLEVWRDQVLTTLLEHGYAMCPLGAFVGQVDDEPELSTTLAELFDRWQAALAEMVDRARGHGRVRQDVDPGDAGRMLLAALEGGTMLAHVHRQATPLRQSLDAAIALLTTGRAAG
ncbi:putative transcriptional regulator, TetR family protein [Planotetraspora thailandica]|uniref:Putative transcriptional regulator, TetR family protein n=1 Tax=Planotetraspora thailandica TaxID=487172 RepID=A0A8J3V0H1_9ACTN|nr:TetR/AcrR family transcriptional regulator [Planotetraspora thailandica]GII54356.1 putative transcriptional regulator, TetR family protein [Planotetraspora thailandica]